MVRFEVHANQMIQVGAKTGFLEQFPPRRFIRSLARLCPSAWQLPIQTPVRVVDQEDVARAVEDDAGSAEGGPLNWEAVTHPGEA